MKGRKVSGNFILILCIFALCLGLTVFSYFYNKTAALVSAALLIIFAAAFVVARSALKRKYRESISAAAFAVSGKNTEKLQSSVMPVLVLSADNEAVWCNDAFKNSVTADSVVGKNLNDIFDELTAQKLESYGSADVAINDKIFKVYSVGSAEKVIYFIDQTALKKTAAEYKFSRPVAAMLEIDSLEEMLRDENGSRRAQVMGDIQQLIEEWFSHTSGIIRPLSDARFFLVFEERYLKVFEEEKFSILENVRNYEFDAEKSLTLSIGVAYGCKTLKEAEIFSRQLLDMALSRGGDQAAVKSPDGEYRFYGGVKAAGEKGSRVRSRITANSLKKMITNAANVVVMGHKFSDLDSIGSALGIAAIAQSCETPVFIATDFDNSLAKPLFRYMAENGFGDFFVTEKQALEQIDQNTLLIITDTHRKSFTEFPDIYLKANQKIVIDHHRKATDFIDDALIFYSEPISSSASEIVTEFWQYIGSGYIAKPIANALLAGIMLDTKNFVMGTGVRTYEAAAYLRKCSADPIAAKKFFAASVDIAKAKNGVVSTAELYKNCAIAKDISGAEDARLICSQAADEMLGIEGVKASFVIFETKNGVSISARSYGEINVQLIMEKLGGGGHRTMAAAMLTDTDIVSAYNALKEKIDEYER